MANLSFSESIHVSCTAEDLYDMVSDITRMGEWSPVCKACWWDEGSSLEVGSWFFGRNETPERTWETKSQVVAADRGREFAFIVGGDRVRWGYSFKTVQGGTELTESWEFLPGGEAFFREIFGDDAQAQVAERARAAEVGIPLTLTAIKVAAEQS